MSEIFVAIARFVFPALVGWIGGDISSIILAKNVHEKGTLVKHTILGNLPKYFLAGIGVVVGVYLSKNVFFPKYFRKKL